MADEPVILNSKTTPVAVAAVRDIDQNLGAAARNAMDPKTQAFKPFTPGSIDERQEATGSVREAG
jgi:hypothetical protein